MRETPRLDCSDVRELITNELDHELTEAMHQRIASHLELCESCKVEAATLHYSVEQVRRLPKPEAAGEWFAERTLDKLLVEHGMDSGGAEEVSEGQLMLWEVAVLAEGKS